MASIGVLQVGNVGHGLRERLEAKYDFYGLWEHKDRDAFLAEKGKLIRAVVSYGSLPVEEDLVSKLPNLEIVSLFSVGYDRVDRPLLKSRGVALTNTPDVLTDCVAETALLLVLSTMRRVVLADRFVRSGEWTKDDPFPVGLQLSDKHVGIVGLGRIGAAIAKRIKSFGSTISYWSRSAKPEYPDYTFYDTVVDLAKNCSILIVACALTEATTKIINREVLDALGPSGFVFNIARGKAIDETELVKALVEKRIAGAGLDVYENEPDVPEKMRALDTVVLLPHIGSGTRETHTAMADLVLANLEAHFSKKPLITPVE